ncbi:MAG: hypothetical protein LBE92_11670 [Chryseobacterium sp.]|jgi:hypothetical protein|uniref:hypothetical protein n=1 Tax=Chryseobacterium sp. TaxID=1871047 RepID=UPI0028223CE8|nr:hypothetical protein [Chryseobacterium sp.]MDR2236772.1 hypothetical protein [Chryseobacterium sp.]
MNESVKLELPFDENTKRENYRFFFQYRWKKSLGELKRVIIYAVLFLSLGFIPSIAIKIGQPSVIFRYGSFLFIGYIFYLLYRYFASKKEAYKLVEKQINDYKRQQKRIDFILLNKDSITIESPFQTLGSDWDSTSYKIISRFLILNILQGKLSFILTKSEFKENDYNVLMDFLQKYSKQEN